MEKNKYNYVLISKLDAGKRQLEFAIKLFLNSSDIVVIHNLASAAHEVLNDLAKKQGVVSIFEGLKNRVREDKKKELINKLNEAKNFFKHADRDENGTLEFAPAQTEYLLIDACNIYAAITQESPSLITAYRTWFFCKHPDLLENKEAEERYRKAGLEFSHTNRAEFLEFASIIEKESLS